MSLVFWFLDIFLFVILASQPPELQTAESMLKKLGSGNFAERSVADAWLRKHLAVVPILERTMANSDLETKRRIASILEFHDYRYARALDAAVTSGTIDEAIDLLSGWHTGKHEDVAWRETCRLTRILIDQSHKQQKILRIEWFEAYAKTPRDVINTKIVDTLNGEKFSFIRGTDIVVRGPKYPAGDITLNGSRGGPASAWIAATGSVELLVNEESCAVKPGVILARGRVTIGGVKNFNLIIVSGDDVAFDGLVNCLIVARGKVTCNFAFGCHIISGKTVSAKAGQLINCSVTENEANPLGYIRWRDAPKAKDVPKAK